MSSLFTDSRLKLREEINRLVSRRNYCGFTMRNLTFGRDRKQKKFTFPTKSELSDVSLAKKEIMSRMNFHSTN